MIIEYQDMYYNEYKKLVKLLWNDIEIIEIEELVHEQKLNKSKIYLYLVEDKVIGFINLSVRNDYVEGCSSLGVGYIEGIYVCEPYRRNQIAYKLVNYAKNYFQKLGLSEIGSDTELENEMSQMFHKMCGFKEVSRNIHYIMKIGE